MVFRRTKSREESHARRSERYSERGREMEARIEKVLKAAKEDEHMLFTRVTRHKPKGIADCDGNDFTVEREVGGRLLRISFGVTISLSSWRRSQKLHCDTPQLFIDYSTPDKRIIERIGMLFSDPKWSSYLQDIGTTITG